ncbi:hypothetical protein [Kitasatospora sp. KL5]|uniref:hypothetical protein n=1 Tax=Kitasatospora sp. KL5 TaxID=3425125 RepID=UPI003D6FF25D
MVDEEHLLKVTDEDLKRFANQEIADFLASYADPSILAVKRFADSKDGRALLTGSGTLGDDALLRSGFGTMCATLDKMLEQFKGQMVKAQADLWAVDSEFQKGHDDALTTAEMLRILQGLTTTTPTEKPGG